VKRERPKWHTNERYDEDTKTRRRWAQAYIEKQAAQTTNENRRRVKRKLPKRQTNEQRIARPKRSKEFKDTPILICRIIQKKKKKKNRRTETQTQARPRPRHHHEEGDARKTERRRQWQEKGERHKWEEIKAETDRDWSRKDKTRKGHDHANDGLD